MTNGNEYSNFYPNGGFNFQEYVPPIEVNGTIPNPNISITPWDDVGTGGFPNTTTITTDGTGNDIQLSAGDEVWLGLKEPFDFLSPPIILPYVNIPEEELSLEPIKFKFKEPTNIRKRKLILVGLLYKTI